MDALIKIENLSRKYGDFCAVNGINFQLHAGEVLGFLGPNGAGKSTTMQMICGTIAPCSGSIHLCGIDLIKHPNQAKLYLGYLPETPPLYPDLTVDEYLIYSAQLRQLDKQGSRDACQRVKIQCGLVERSQQLIGTLSKGYQQRVGIAQAIIHDPRVIVLDEPTNGLDPNQIKEIQFLIKQLAKERGVLISSHILPEVESLCDRVMILHRGELVYAHQISDAASNSIQVQLENPPDLTEIQQLSGVVSAKATPHNIHAFEITLESLDHRPNLARQLVENGWGLSEFKCAQSRLEQTFYQLTQGDIG